MMTLAKESGLDVADVELVDVKAILGLLPGLDVVGDTALAVRRFDRQRGLRVHMEDFAQVLDVRVAEKCSAANFETIARIVGRVAKESVEELVRRMVFVVAIGNDGVHARLSPAYDLLSTIEFLPDDDLGLNLARSKRFEDIGMESFLHLGRKADLAVDVEAIVRSQVERVREAWTRLRADLPMVEVAKANIESHWGRVPLMGKRSVR
jgi:serine/threonine-protein kinase HipA